MGGSITPISKTQPVDDVTIEVNNAGQLEVKNEGILTAKLADEAVTNDKIADATITASKAIYEYKGTPTSSDTQIASSDGVVSALTTSFETVKTLTIDTISAGTPILIYYEQQIAASTTAESRVMINGVQVGATFASGTITYTPITQISTVLQAGDVITVEGRRVTGGGQNQFRNFRLFFGVDATFTPATPASPTAS
jgi:hypothetical protein